MINADPLNWPPKWYNTLMPNQTFPNQLKRYFWGDDTESLSLEKNKKYILQVILERGDSRAVRWLLSNLGRQSVKRLLPSIRLSKKSAAFWKTYFS